MGGNVNNQLHAVANDWTMAMRFESRHQIDPYPETGGSDNRRLRVRSRKCGQRFRTNGTHCRVASKGRDKAVVAGDHARPFELPVE